MMKKPNGHAVLVAACGRVRLPALNELLLRQGVNRRHNAVGLIVVRLHAEVEHCRGLDAVWLSGGIGISEHAPNYFATIIC